MCLSLVVLGHTTVFEWPIVLILLPHLVFSACFKRRVSQEGNCVSPGKVEQALCRERFALLSHRNTF